MSTIDNRIVRMQFDNAKFEAGVSQSMSTLDKLTEKLKFKNVSDGVAPLQKALANLDLSRIEAGIDKITSRFSALGIAGMEIVKRLTNNALNGLKQIESATIGQIKSGGWNRAMNLANAKFTIEGLKLDWQEMNKAINYGVQDTAYGLDSAAKAAASLAASGVDYKESIEGANDSMMHTTLRAISGVASMTNSTYDDIADVFTQVAGLGKVTGDTIRSLANRGMNLAATLAEAFGTSEADIRELVRKGKISFKDFATAMDNAFGEHAKAANDTFQGALSNMKAALSRIGAIFAGPIIDKTNIFFLAIKKRIGEVQSALSDLTEEVEINGKKVKQVVQERFATHFAEAWEAAMIAASKIVESIDISFIQKIADLMDEAAQKATFLFNTISDVFDKLKGESKDAAKEIGVSVDSAVTALDIFFNGKYGNGAARVKALKQAGKDAEEVQKFINDFVKAGMDVNKMTMTIAGTSAEDFSKYLTEYIKVGYKAEKVTTKLGESIQNVGEEEDEFSSFIEKISGTINDVRTAASNFGTAVKDVVGTIANLGVSFAKFLTEDADISSFSQRLVSITSEIKTFTGYLKNLSTIVKGFATGDSLYDRTAAYNEEGEKLAFVIYNIASALKNIIATVNTLTGAFVSFGIEVGKLTIASIDWVGISQDINVLTTGIRDWANAFKDVSKAGNLDNVTKKLEGLYAAYEKADNDDAKDSIAKQIELTELQASRMISARTIIDSVSKVLSTLVYVFRNVAGAALNVGKAIAKAFTKVFNPAGIADGVAGLSGTFMTLSDVLYALSEKAAPAIEGAFTVIFSTVQSLITVALRAAGAIGDFITKIFRGKETVDETADSLDRLGESADTPETAFDKILDICSKLAEKISELPDIIEGFFDALSQSQGVKRLGTAIDDVAKAIKEAIGNGLDEFSEAVPAIGENSDDSASGVSALVTVIDWLADKLAWVIEQVPGWITQVEEFADRAQEKIGGAIDYISGKIDAFKKSNPAIADAIGDADSVAKIVSDPEEFDKALVRTEKFSKSIGESIRDGFANVDWSSAASIGVAVAAIVELIKLSKLTDSITSIPKGIGGIFKSIAAFFKSASQATKYMAIASIITSISIAFVVLCGALVILSGVPQPQLDKALNVIILVGALIGALIWLATKFEKGKKTTEILAKNAKSMFSGNYVSFFGTIGQFGLLVAGMGAAVWLIAKSMEKLVNLWAGKETAFWAAVAVIGGIMTLLIVLTVAVGRLAKELEHSDPKNALLKGNDTIKGVLKGMAAFLIGLSVSIAIIAGAIWILAQTFDKANIASSISSVVIVGALMAGLVYVIKMVIQATKDVPVKNILATALLVVVMAGAVFALVGAFALILGIVSAFTAVGAEAAVSAAFMGIAVIMLAMAGSLKMIISSMRGVEDPLGVIFVLLSAAILFGVIGGVVSVLAGITGIGDNIIKIVACIGGLVAAIGLVLGIFAVAMHKAKVGPKELIGYAAGFMAMGAAILLFGAGIKALIDAVSGSGEAFGQVAALLVIFFGVFALIAGLMAAFGGNEFADAFLKIGAGFALAGAAALLLGLGLIAISAALTMLVPILPLLLSSVDEFFKILEEHWMMLLGITAAIVVIVALIVKAAEVVIPLLTGLLDIAKICIEGIVNLLASGGKAFGEWFAKLKPKTKAVIVSLILSVCSALTETGPAMFQTIGSLIIGLLDFIIGAIPAVVEKLILIIVSIIDGLADAIIGNQHKIAAALWSVVGSILMLLNTVLREGLMMLFGKGVGGKLAEWLGLDSETKRLTQNIKDMRDEAEEADKQVREILAGKRTAEGGSILITPADVGISAGQAIDNAIDDKAKEIAQNEDQKKYGMLSGNKFGLGFSKGSGDSMAKGFNLNLDDLPEGCKDALAGSGMDMGADFGENFAGGAVDIDSMMKTAGINTDAYAKGVASSDSKVKTATDEGYKQPTVESLDEMGDEAEEKTGQMVDRMTDVLWEKRKTYQGMFHNQYVTQPIKQFQVSMGSDLPDAVTGAIQGATDGAKDKASEFNSVIENDVGKKSVKMLRNAWEEHSPSKVFYRIASFAIQGLTNGIEQNTGLVTNATGNLSDQIITSLGDPMAYIGAMANGDIQYDPSIRPILDSSNIVTGARGINGLFQNQNVSLSGLSGELAADLGQINGNNQDIVEQLAALRTDMQDMTQKIEGMQVVMDSGALVGSIAGGMDTALGKRASYKRRGN